MRRRALLSLLLMAFACAFVSAQERASERLEALLNSPDKTEIPYHIEITKPVLMFQQQYLVEVLARFSHKLIQTGELRHPQMIIRMQDGTGKWLSGEEFDDFEIPSNARKEGVEYAVSVYLKPGRYRIAIAMTDVETQKSNVLHRDVLVPPLASDPFPQIDATLPVVEFPDRVTGHRGLWLIGPEAKPVILDDSKHKRVDVVLNITKRSRWDMLYRIDVQKMLEAGRALSSLRPANGCVRVSIVDALRLKVILDRFPAEKLNWTKLQEQIENIDQTVVDVHELENQRKVAEFVNSYLQEIAYEKSACGGNGDTSPPLVVVVSPDVVLPAGNKIGELPPLPRERYVYVHVGGGAGWMDGVGQILSRAKPQKISCSTPQHFRLALAKVARIITSGPN